MERKLRQSQQQTVQLFLAGNNRQFTTNDVTNGVNVLASFLFLNIELLNFYFLTSCATFPLENILQENKLCMAVFVLKLAMCHIFIIRGNSRISAGRTVHFERTASTPNSPNTKKFENFLIGRTCRMMPNELLIFDMLCVISIIISLRNIRRFPALSRTPTVRTLVDPDHHIHVYHI